MVDEAFDQSATDFTPLVSKVKAAKPDAFLVWVAGPAPVIITKQFADQRHPALMTGAAGLAAVRRARRAPRARASP